MAIEERRPPGGYPQELGADNDDPFGIDGIFDESPDEGFAPAEPSQAAELDVPEFLRLSRAHHRAAKNAKGRKAITIVGDTTAGKTVLLHFILGHELTWVGEGINKYLQCANRGESNLAQIGKGLNSCTGVANVIPLSRARNPLLKRWSDAARPDCIVDLAGFADFQPGKGMEPEIANGYGRMHVLRALRSTFLVWVIDAKVFQPVKAGRSIGEVLEAITTTLGSVRDAADRVLFLLNKIPEGKEDEWKAGHVKYLVSLAKETYHTKPEYKAFILGMVNFCLPDSKKNPEYHLNIRVVHPVRGATDVWETGAEFLDRHLCADDNDNKHKRAMSASSWDNVDIKSQLRLHHNAGGQRVLDSSTDRLLRNVTKGDFMDDCSFEQLLDMAILCEDDERTNKLREAVAYVDDRILKGRETARSFAQHLGNTLFEGGGRSGTVIDPHASELADRLVREMKYTTSVDSFMKELLNKCPCLHCGKRQRRPVDSEERIECDDERCVQENGGKFNFKFSAEDSEQALRFCGFHATLVPPAELWAASTCGPNVGELKGVLMHFLDEGVNGVRESTERRYTFTDNEYVLRDVDTGELFPSVLECANHPDFGRVISLVQILGLLEEKKIFEGAVRSARGHLLGEVDTFFKESVGHLTAAVDRATKLITSSPDRDRIVDSWARVVDFSSFCCESQRLLVKVLPEWEAQATEKVTAIRGLLEAALREVSGKFAEEMMDMKNAMMAQAAHNYNKLTSPGSAFAVQLFCCTWIRKHLNLVFPPQKCKAQNLLLSDMISQWADFEDTVRKFQLHLQAIFEPDRLHSFDDVEKGIIMMNRLTLFGDYGAEIAQFKAMLLNCAHNSTRELQRFFRSVNSQDKHVIESKLLFLGSFTWVDAIAEDEREREELKASFTKVKTSFTATIDSEMSNIPQTEEKAKIVRAEAVVQRINKSQRLLQCIEELGIADWTEIHETKNAQYVECVGKYVESLKELCSLNFSDDEREPYTEFREQVSQLNHSFEQFQAVSAGIDQSLGINQTFPVKHMMDQATNKIRSRLAVWQNKLRTHLEKPLQAPEGGTNGSYFDDESVRKVVEISEAIQFAAEETKVNATIQGPFAKAVQEAEGWIRRRRDELRGHFEDADMEAMSEEELQVEKKKAHAFRRIFRRLQAPFPQMQEVALETPYNKITEAIKRRKAEEAADITELVQSVNFIALRQRYDADARNAVMKGIQAFFAAFPKTSSGPADAERLGPVHKMLEDFKDLADAFEGSADERVIASNMATTAAPHVEWVRKHLDRVMEEFKAHKVLFGGSVNTHSLDRSIEACVQSAGDLVNLCAQFEDIDLAGYKWCEKLIAEMQAARTAVQQWNCKEGADQLIMSQVVGALITLDRVSPRSFTIVLPTPGQNIRVVSDVRDALRDRLGRIKEDEVLPAIECGNIALLTDMAKDMQKLHDHQPGLISWVSSCIESMEAKISQRVDPKDVQGTMKLLRGAKAGKNPAMYEEKLASLLDTLRTCQTDIDTYTKPVSFHNERTRKRLEEAAKTLRDFAKHKDFEPRLVDAFETALDRHQALCEEVQVVSMDTLVDRLRCVRGLDTVGTALEESYEPKLDVVQQKANKALDTELGREFRSSEFPSLRERARLEVLFAKLEKWGGVLKEVKKVCTANEIQLPFMAYLEEKLSSGSSQFQWQQPPAVAARELLVAATQEFWDEFKTGIFPKIEALLTGTSRQDVFNPTNTEHVQLIQRANESLRLMQQTSEKLTSGSVCVDAHAVDHLYEASTELVETCFRNIQQCLLDGLQAFPNVPDANTVDCRYWAATQVFNRLEVFKAHALESPVEAAVKLLQQKIQDFVGGGSPSSLEDLASRLCRVANSAQLFDTLEGVVKDCVEHTVRLWCEECAANQGHSPEKVRTMLSIQLNAKPDGPAVIVYFGFNQGTEVLIPTGRDPSILAQECADPLPLEASAGYMDRLYNFFYSPVTPHYLIMSLRLQCYQEFHQSFNEILNRNHHISAFRLKNGSHENLEAFARDVKDKFASKLKPGFLDVTWQCRAQAVAKHTNMDVIVSHVQVILPYLAVLMACLRAGPEFTDAGKDRHINVPLPTQVWAIYQLLNCYSRDCRPAELRYQFIQIGTGEGKSIIEGLTAAVLCMFGFEVFCVCYSESLSRRDWEDFLPLFKILGFAGAERSMVRYGTYEDLCKMVYCENLGNPQTQYMSFMRGETNIEKPPRVTPWNRKVLLLDESDKLFSEENLGRVYKIAGRVHNAASEDLISFVYEHRNNDDLSLTQVQEECDAYKQLAAHEFKRATSILDRQVQFMVNAAKQNAFLHSPHQHEVRDQTVYYKMHDRWMPAYEARDGYRSAFLYLHHNLSNRRQDVLYVSLPAGRFSYSHALREFGAVMGLSGTVKHMTAVEIQLVQELFTSRGAPLLGKMPCPFNSQTSDKPYDSLVGFRVLSSKQEWNDFIYDQAIALSSGNEGSICPVIVIFEDDHVLDEFDRRIDDRKARKKNPMKVLKPSKTFREQQETIRGAGYVPTMDSGEKAGIITLTTRDFGRGSDFGTTQGVMNVLILAYIPENPAEMSQNEGRVARMNNPGQVRIFLYEDQIGKALNVSEADRETVLGGKDKPWTWKAIEKLRDARYEDRCASCRRRLQSALNIHKESMRMHTKLIRGNLTDAEAEHITQFLALCERQPSVLSIVLDVSWSMYNENRFRPSVEAIKLFLSQVAKEGDWVSINRFGVRSTLGEFTTDMGSIQRELSCLADPSFKEFEKGTFLRTAVVDNAQRLQDFGRDHEGSEQFMIILTDGENHDRRVAWEAPVVAGRFHVFVVTVFEAEADDAAGQTGDAVRFFKEMSTLVDLVKRESRNGEYRTAAIINVAAGGNSDFTEAELINHAFVQVSEEVDKALELH